MGKLCKQCAICGTDCGKGKTCSDKCRKALQRQSVTNVPVEPDIVTPIGPSVTDSPKIARIMGSGVSIPDFGGPECGCKHCAAVRKSGKPYILNHGAYKSGSELGPMEYNRVSLPGDLDYAGS